MTKRKVVPTFALAGLWVLAGYATAGQNPTDVQISLEGCKKEMKTYCKNVTLGEGRLLACFYAHEDKLSDRCVYTLYQASQKLQDQVAKLTYAAKACDADLDKYCADVAPGEGRLLSCLDKREKEVSASCKQAIKDTGLKK